MCAHEAQEPPGTRLLLSARRLRMPARETEAIILKTFPLGEADRLVSFLGRTSGRMRGVAAGARRIKNRYGSTLQVMSHVQLWYVEKETRDLVRIQQCELLESLNKSQSDYGLSTGLAAGQRDRRTGSSGARSLRSHVPADPAHGAGNGAPRQLAFAARLLRVLDGAPGGLAAALR